KAFENGLPKDATDLAATTGESNWGVVPTTQSVVNAFAITDENSNRTQDVGLDGLSDQFSDSEGRSEQSFFSDYLNNVGTVVTNGTALAEIQADPSADNYSFFRGSQFDSDPTADMLKRYKLFNGLEGNSITDEDSPEDYPTQATTLPSTEDINQDQNLSENENYFQYKVSIRPEDMVVGQGYITDRVLGTHPVSGKQVYWYQYKVPIRVPDKVVNGIQDFRSIRFMRMFLKGWQQEAVLRFARLEFVRGEWRKYNFSLETPGEGIGGDPDLTTYETAAVNVEENGNRVPINYVLPPGINQEIDVASANLRNLNEQSLQLRTCNLRDGDARASFRNVQFDIRSYKKMQMYIHAESADPNDLLEYGDISVFIRLGNDFDQNYYEYEVPVTPSVFFNNDPFNVWPEENNMIIEFARLNDAKIARDQSGFAINQRYMEFEGSRRIFVKGNPNLSRMNTIMIGIRNPKKDGAEANPWNTDDAQPKCAEVWVNELRLTDFDQRGGWAALGRLNTTLADLGTVSVAGNYSTPFWGSIEDRVSERQRETNYGVDVAANVELGKFIPESAGIKVPMFIGYSEQISDPQFDPLNPDIEFDDATRNLTVQERRERKKLSRTYTRRRSINFTNVHKERKGGKKERPWDVENLSVSYAYSDMEFRDINTEFDNNTTHRGSIAYTHAPRPIPVKPFENIGFISKSKWLKLIKEFNFNVGFKQINLRTAIDRSYSERLIRPNPDIESLPLLPTYNKNFNWNSQYGFRYEITKSLKLDFNANNNAVIGETPGRVDPKFQDEYQLWKDSVLTSLQNWGETTGYDHTVNLTYQLPLDKFPLTDWITANTAYTAGYQWDRAPFQQDTLGHVIQNSQNISVNGQFNFVNLYNKSKWLKKINSKGRASRGGTGRARPGQKGQTDDKKDEDKEGNKFNILEALARVVMVVRNGNVTYSQNGGTLLPGYNRKTNVFGMDNFDAPGIGFVLGQQNYGLSGDLVRDFASTAAEEGWLVQNESIFNPYTSTRTETINGRMQLEPFTGLRIDLSLNRTISSNRSSFYRWRDSLQTYVEDSPQDFGNFSVSIITWGTTFASDDDNFVNANFQQFLDNRQVVSERLGELNVNSEFDPDSGYYSGYYGTAQNVIIPSFIAAYSGQNAERVKLDPFKMFPLPNWDITYDGLSRMEPFKKWFRTFTINHSYRSTFNIGQYQTNLLWTPDGLTRDAAMNFLPERQITVVTISEVIRPFINFDMTLQNSLLAKFEYNTDRNLSLGLTNNQLTEVRGKEYVIGTGYRLRNVKFPLTIGGNRPKSDLNLRVDLSLRENTTVIRRIAEEQNQVTAGQNIVSIKASADYVISQRLNVRAFYERVVNKPVISTSFPSANTNVGISLRFTLTQ
ncbi:MAG: cell surface protein SprA, partial [Flavobacteriales bacterium]|nr:cell surface protein SprA [Flavobacteriales bacterium]